MLVLLGVSTSWWQLLRQRLYWPSKGAVFASHLSESSLSVSQVHSLLRTRQLHPQIPLVALRVSSHLRNSDCVYLCLLPSLTALDLQGCTQISDTGLSAVAQHLTSLTSLDLSGCGQISDTGLSAVAQHLTSLTSLNLSGCELISDTGLSALAQRLPFCCVDR